MPTNPKFYILIPVHNRREVTLNCLKQLQPLLNEGDWKICVIDDASTDGTADAISKEYPATKILEGSGNLYWTGAVEMGMRYAIRSGAQCCVWLNDDITIDFHTLENLTSRAVNENCVVSAQGKIRYEDGSIWCFPATYWTPSDLQFIPVDDSYKEPYAVDSCRGNLVAFPKSVVERIGYPDGKNIPHAGGDTDYTLRATRSGFKCIVDPNLSVFEEENIRMDNRSWLLDHRSPAQILRQSLAKRGVMYPRMLFTYNIRHWGTRGLIKTLIRFLHLFTILVVKTIFPKSLLLTLFAKHSHSYQAYAARGIRNHPPE